MDSSGLATSGSSTTSLERDRGQGLQALPAPIPACSVSAQERLTGWQGVHFCRCVGQDKNKPRPPGDIGSGAAHMNSYLLQTKQIEGFCLISVFSCISASPSTSLFCATLDGIVQYLKNSTLSPPPPEKENPVSPALQSDAALHWEHERPGKKHRIRGKIMRRLLPLVKAGEVPGDHEH